MLLIDNNAVIIYLAYNINICTYIRTVPKTSAPFSGNKGIFLLVVEEEDKLPEYFFYN